MSDVVAPQDLTRALLARQHLTARWAGPGVDLVRHLVGLQAQNPTSPYLAAWSRLEGAAGTRAAELSRAVEERRLVRVSCLRGTVHLVTAEDALVLPALTDPVNLAPLTGSAASAAAVRDLPLGDVAAAARDHVEASPATPQELDRALAARWPGRPPGTLSRAARSLLHLVQVTPRGQWGASAATRWTTVSAWLGVPDEALVDPEARAAALRDVVRRYLAAFGPASVADVQTWSGLRGLRPVLDALRPELVVTRAPATATGRPGRELFDVPGLPDRTAPDDVPAVRLLPDFDNLTLSHADRTRVVDDDVRQRIATPNGVLPSLVLVHGRVAATWRVEPAREGPAVVRVAPLTARPLPLAALDAEVRRMLALVAPAAADDARLEVAAPA